MRASFARFAMVVATLSAVAGCRSGGGGSPWGFGHKKDAPAMGESGPQLPTASAMPPSYGSSYAANGQPQGPSAFADPNQAPPYQPQPNGYAATTPPGAPPVDQTAMTQQGPYSESYGQPAGGQQPYPAAGYPSTGGYPDPNAGGYPSTGAPGAYAATSPSAPPAAADPYTGMPGGGYGAPAAGDVAQAAPPAGNPYDAGNSYPPNEANSAEAYRTANTDIRYGTPPDPYGAQPEQAAANSYGASPPMADYGAAAPGATATAQASPGATQSYQPGSTGYNPGQTGYSPPGVAPYEMAAAPNVVAQARKDPYYRPGGTSDFTPVAAAQTPSAATMADQYNPPPIGADYADPYAPAAGGYQATSPAAGGAPVTR